MTVANGRCTSEPIPVEREAGNNPKIATVAVIKIGRKRCLTPLNTATFNTFPSALRLLICVIIITPFWMATPINAMNPTADDTFKVIPRRFKANIPPKRANGTTIINNSA